MVCDLLIFDCELHVLYSCKVWNTLHAVYKLWHGLFGLMSNMLEVYLMWYYGRFTCYEGFGLLTLRILHCLDRMDMLLSWPYIEGDETWIITPQSHALSPSIHLGFRSFVPLEVEIKNYEIKPLHFAVFGNKLNLGLKSVFLQRYEYQLVLHLLLQICH